MVTSNITLLERARKEHPYIVWLKEYNGLVISERMIIEWDRGFFWGRQYYERGKVYIFMRESKRYFISKKETQKVADSFAVNESEDNLFIYSLGIVQHPEETRVKRRLGDTK